MSRPRRAAPTTSPGPHPTCCSHPAPVATRVGQLGVGDGVVAAHRGYPVGVRGDGLRERGEETGVGARAHGPAARGQQPPLAVLAEQVPVRRHLLRRGHGVRERVAVQPRRSACSCASLTRSMLASRSSRQQPRERVLVELDPQREVRLHVGLRVEHRDAGGGGEPFVAVEVREVEADVERSAPARRAGGPPRTGSRASRAARCPWPARRRQLGPGHARSCDSRKGTTLMWTPSTSVPPLLGDAAVGHDADHDLGVPGQQRLHPGVHGEQHVLERHPLLAGQLVEPQRQLGRQVDGRKPIRPSWMSAAPDASDGNGASARRRPARAPRTRVPRRPGQDLAFGGDEVGEAPHRWLAGTAAGRSCEQRPVVGEDARSSSPTRSTRRAWRRGSSWRTGTVVGEYVHGEPHERRGRPSRRASASPVSHHASSSACLGLRVEVAQVRHVSGRCAVACTSCSGCGVAGEVERRAQHLVLGDGAVHGGAHRRVVVTARRSGT